MSIDNSNQNLKYFALKIELCMAGYHTRHADQMYTFKD